MIEDELLERARRLVMNGMGVSEALRLSVGPEADKLFPGLRSIEEAAQQFVEDYDRLVESRKIRFVRFAHTYTPRKQEEIE